jgi:spore germination protein YaaH
MEPVINGSTHTITRQRSGLLKSLLITLLILNMAGVGVGLGYWLKNIPNSDHVSPYPSGIAIPIAHQGKWLDASAVVEDGQVYLPLSVVNLWADPKLVWDESSSNVILTSAGKVIQMETDQLTAYVNDEPFPLRFPVQQIDGEVYLPMDPLAHWLGLSVTLLDLGKMVLVEQDGEVITWGKLKTLSKPDKFHAIRQSPGIQSPIVAEAQPEEKVKIQGEQEGWYIVQKSTGEIGFLDKNEVLLGERQAIELERDDQRPFLPWRPVGGKIHMTWEYVYSKTASPAKIGNVTGLNVVSPTWFELLDGEGNIQSKADLSYVRWAHDQGFQVWGLFSNGFDPDRTHEVLSTFETRKKMTRQLLAFAEMYELDGINIDFENVYLKDKDALVQWVREAAPLLHDQGLVISMDITTKSLSETWSMFYDRPALGKLVDYLVLMAYDEHWASSPTAGSVASLPWVERGVKQLIEEEGVSPSKIILGVPFYTRLWSEEVIDGEIKVSSKALSMDTVTKIIKEKGLEKAYLEEEKQNFVSWQEEEVTYKIWLEDEMSMAHRIDLVSQYRLAGLASWRRGFQNEAMIPLIAEQLEERP